MPMNNFIFTGYPAEADWIQYDAALHNHSSMLPQFPLPPYLKNPIQYHELPSYPVDVLAKEDRDTSPSKSHSQAEKRRRDRINAQLTALRKLIPKSDKMDKAALLGSVIDQVKELKRKASEVSEDFTIPTEVDEVIIDCDVAGNLIPSEFEKFDKHDFIKASLCCEDRPELFRELISVLSSQRLTTVKADISSVGGRIKSILILCCKDGVEGICLGTLKRSLKAILSRIVSMSMATNSHIRSKRQRFFFPSQCSQ